MTDSQRIASIAGKLTNYARRALIYAAVWDGEHYARFSGVPAILVADHVHGRGDRLNELGLLVRAHLMEQDA